MSKIFSIDAPLSHDSKSATYSAESYHISHRRWETKAPMSVLIPIKEDGKTYVVGAFFCTPIVKYPIDDLQPGAKVKGTGVIELGSGNRPLDMFVYQKGGKDFILLANSARGVMKITTSGIAGNEGITDPIRGTAGQTYDTISELKGVVQLDRLNEGNAVVLVRGDDGSLDLQTVALP